MSLTYGNLKRHVILALGGQPSIVSGVTREERISEIINQAGTYLFAKQWRFRERTSRPLSVVANQNWVALPTDVDEIISLTSKAGMGFLVEMTTPEHMEVLRTALEPGLMQGTFYACLSRPWAQSNGTTPLVDGTGIPAVRLEVYPTPSASSSDTLIIRYRAAWVPVSSTTDDAYLIPVPPYAEALLVAYARAFAMAYEDEGLSARLIEIDGGPVYDSASIKDGIHQRDYGRMPTQRVGPFRRGSGSVSAGYGAVGALLAPATAFSNIRWRGVWSGSSTYAIGDVVRHGTNVYIAVIGSTNSTPPSSSWELMVQDGAVGPTGLTGNTGANGQGVPVGGSSGQVLAKSSGSDYDTGWITPAPTGADYLVKTANADLSAERVVTDSTSVTANWGTSGQVAFERAALTGDVTASANSNATTIANDAVTYAKMQNVSATDRLLGRQSAGAGDVEEITCTSAGRALIDDADAAAQRTTLGVVAGGAGDIWVEKAGDTMTGQLTVSRGTISSGNGTSVSATYTSTTGSALCNQTFMTVAPTSDSATQFSAFFARSTYDTASNLTGTSTCFNVQGGLIGSSQSGTITRTEGLAAYASIIATGSASPTITTAIGAAFTPCATFNAGATPTVTTAIGADVNVTNGSGWTITNGTGIRVQNPAASSITTLVGVDVQGQTRGSGTNVGVRIAAASGGSTTAALQLSGTTGTASGILFGTDTNLFRRSANLLATDDTFEALNVSGTNTGDQLTYSTFTPVDNAPPAANAATSGLRNRIPVLEFDDATDETAYFIDVMPQGAKLTSGLKVRIHWTAATATSGNCFWAVAFERLNTGIDADSFGADTLSAAATNATSGVPNVTEITVTTIDGITAGDAYRLRIVRQGSNVLDTMTGDAQIIAVEIRSAV